MSWLALGGALPFAFGDELVEGADDAFEGLEAGAVNGDDVFSGVRGVAEFESVMERGGVGAADGGGAGEEFVGGGRGSFAAGDEEMAEQSFEAGSGFGEDGGEFVGTIHG